MQTGTAKTNPEIDQDRTDIVEMFDKYGYVMFPQQRAIYKHIQKTIGRSDAVLEAGCGHGLGTAILEQSETDAYVCGTDKLPRNVNFASQLYPWIGFCVWDINNPVPAPLPRPFDWVPVDEPYFTTVVAVEVIEHVANPTEAIRNLIDVCKDTLWMSTPNGAVTNENPPSNTFHVSEYTPEQMYLMIRDAATIAGITMLGIRTRHWETFEQLDDYNKDVNPLVYEITLER